MLVIDWAHFLESGLPLGGKFSSMTVGVFDGVHRGHRELIGKVVSHSRENVPVVITFRENHKTREHADDIQTFQQKLDVFESLSIQITLAIDFSESFRRMSGLEFLELLFKHGKIGFFAIGSNFRCGYKLDTDAAAIRDFFASRSIPAEIVPEVLENGLPISSSRIRAAIASGDFSLAERMLGSERRK